MTSPSLSVVVPAHNEEPVIESMLRGLLADAEAGELEVIVVCNGCTDRTAEIARSIGEPVTVFETDIGSKPVALNLADEHASTFPRFYVDADVRVELAALRRCAEALRDGALAAAPALHVDTSASSWPVRSYYRIWTELPWVSEAMVGSGIFGVSRTGRQRFDTFPLDGADDLWFSAQFAPDERRSVRSHRFTVDASPNARQLIRRRSRIIAANQLLADRLDGLPGAPTGGGGFVGVLRRSPGLAPHALPFVAISLAARLRARWMIAGGSIAWEGDERTARPAPETPRS